MMNTHTSSLFVGWKLPFDEDLFEQIMDDNRDSPFDCVVDQLNASYILIGEFEIENLKFKVVPQYDGAFEQRLESYKQTLITEYGDSFADLFSQAEYGSFLIPSDPKF
jgi:hypothetical protein